ncbi:MAG: M28 family peptidase [Chitinophagaceae bacterium]
MNRIICLAALFSFVQLNAQHTSKPLSALDPPGLSLITSVDLRHDLFSLASDSMRGRRAGTTDELRAAVWVAEQARKAGLLPAGDDGTYFQFFPIRRTMVGAESRLKINEKQLALWKDAWVTSPVNATLHGPVVWLNSMGDTTNNVAGKIVAINIQPPVPMPAPGMSLWGYRYILSAVRQQTSVLRRKGVAAILLVADDLTESSIAFAGHGFEEGSYVLENSLPAAAINSIPILIVRKSLGSLLAQPGATVSLDIDMQSFIYPSVNVIAKAVGTDAVLKKEFVLFSGHHDHDGVGPAIGGDSIWNGADDNATVSVALLAIGRAWAKKPGKRSALFVWHGAEERGLLGSRWFVDHPTVEKQSIIAVLNGDMIGRNNPDSAALLGTQAPHKNSSDLVAMALAANKESTHFLLDTLWDKKEHPEGWYFRSDHLPYARAGIPSIFYTTLLHDDYHTPKDESNRIDINKLYKMTQWMYRTGWKVSETKQKPRVDDRFKLER